MLATIGAIASRLTDERGLVSRFRSASAVDGLAGEEGAFLLCTFRLAQALALAGQVDRAREVFNRAARYLNDVDCLPRRSTRPRVSCWVTSRKRLATSV